MATQGFDTVLARYQQNLTEFKTTGNAALQGPVTTDKTWLDSYVASLERGSRAQQTVIQTFLSNYETANPDLLQMQKKLKEIRVTGPILQDAYRTEVNANAEEPIDFTMHYVKAGLIAGVGVLIAVVSVFLPLPV